jgi:transcriptional regulator with XRE-family HTH domain
MPDVGSRLRLTDRTDGGQVAAVAVSASDDHEPLIGAQLKAARLASRKTLAEVAAESGLTKGFVSKLERDQAAASVASLMRLCQSLGISVGSLFHASKGEVVRHAAYPPINFGGSGITEFLLTPHGERRVQAILSQIEPGGGSGDELYGLPADVEFVFVIEGRLQVSLQDHDIVLEAGDAFTFPPRTEHCFRSVATGGATRVLWVFTPALPVDSTAEQPTGARVVRALTTPPSTPRRRREQSR